MGQFDGSGQWDISAVTAGSAFTHTGTTTTAVGGIPTGSGPYLAYPLQSLMSDMLYPYVPPTFTAFAMTGVSLLECGDVITGMKSFAFTDTQPANIQPNTLDISDAVVGLLLHNVSVVSPKAKDFTATPVEFDVIGSDAFTIAAKDIHATPFSMTRVINWNWRLYVGEQAGAGNLNQGQIKALAIINQVNSSCFGTYHFPAAATYKTICVPTDWAQPTSFKDSSTGFNVPFNIFYTVAVTNALGQTENYKCYMSVNIINSDIDIVVS